MVVRFVYLGSCITVDVYIEDEMTIGIAKARLAFTDLRDMWRRHGIHLSLKGQVYSASVRAVLLYGCDTLLVRAADVQRLSVFEPYCLRSIGHIWW